MKKIMNINGFFYWDKYNTTDVYLPRKIYPTLYLNSNIYVKSRDETSDNPYQIFLNLV